jgi:hypothetical protein
MTVRDLSKSDQIQSLNIWIEGRQIHKVNYTGNDYHVWFGTGEYIIAKGHEKIENLSFPKNNSNSRIRRYGRFGTSI